ncbi:MAG: methyltransferase domain-containing protein [Propionibacteriaceae bacterium]|jgi:SAM-dependent methyltransferase|nr:methyltransferase domain-containing protein [Propionibacteriaceae bacterium]
MSEPRPDSQAAQFWEARYATSDQIWSGRANQALVAVATDLSPGRALDLGCGEGADSIWLAQQGWRVTGLDISPTALARAERAAAQAGLPDGHIRWIAHDLTTWASAESYDLVTACFLQSPIEFPRVDVLRRVADLVAANGHLLIVSHACAPPWADQPDGHHHRFLTPTEEIEALDLPTTGWDIQLAQTRSRPATGPDGQSATLDDAIVLLHRK